MRKSRTITLLESKVVIDLRHSSLDPCTLWSGTYEWMATFQVRVDKLGWTGNQILGTSRKDVFTRLRVGIVAILNPKLAQITSRIKTGGGLDMDHDEPGAWTSDNVENFFE